MAKRTDLGLPHCIRCGRVITRTAAFDAVKENIKAGKPHPSAEFVVKCKCGVSITIIMGKGDRVRSILLKSAP